MPRIGGVVGCLCLLDPPVTRLWAYLPPMGTFGQRNRLAFI
jgi:hypothetical protein